MRWLLAGSDPKLISMSKKYGQINRTGFGLAALALTISALSLDSRDLARASRWFGRIA